MKNSPVRRVKLFRKDNKPDWWLSLEEETALLKKCDQRLRVFVLTAVGTGFRARELQALRDWKAKTCGEGEAPVFGPWR